MKVHQLVKVHFDVSFEHNGLRALIKLCLENDKVEFPLRRSHFLDKWGMAHMHKKLVLRLHIHKTSKTK